MADSSAPDAVKSKAAQPEVEVNEHKSEESGNDSNDSDSSSSDSDESTSGSTSGSASDDDSPPPPPGSGPAADQARVPPAEVQVDPTEVESGLNLSVESFKSADVTLTRAFENDVNMQAAGSNVISPDLELKDKTSDISVALKSDPVAKASTPGPSQRPPPAIGATPSLKSELQRSLMSLIGTQPPAAPEPPNNAAGVIDASKSRKGKSKDKKSKKDKEVVSQRPVVAAQDSTVTEQNRVMEEGRLLARMVANFIADTEGKSTPRKRKVTTKDLFMPDKSVEVSQAKKSKASESQSDSESNSSSSSSDRPCSSNRISRIPADRQYLQQAMARAKHAGSIRNAPIRAEDLAEALRRADVAQYRVHPDMAYRNYHSVPGTGLPHIRRHANRLQQMFGPILGATARLHITLARNQNQSKRTLVSMEPGNAYATIGRFNNDLHHTVPSASTAMQNAPCSSSAAEVPVSVDFDQLELGLDSQSQPLTKHRKRKSTKSSPSKSKKTDRGERKHKNKKTKKKKKTKSKKSE